MKKFDVMTAAVSQRDGRMPSVLLVSLPWTTVTQPSLGLGLLRAVLDAQGIPCRVQHLNLFLLRYLKAITYQMIANMYGLNDFLFSGVLDPGVTNAQQRILREKAREILTYGMADPYAFGGSEGIVQVLLDLRNNIIPAWMEKCADEIASSDATLVGFTCMFDQTISSLAMARLVKEKAPEKMLALGGYAVRSPVAGMLIKSSPWIDAVCDGEGETTVVELARASAGKIPLNEVSGVVFRSAKGYPIFSSHALPADLEKNPTPNFDDFFADIRRLSEEHMVDVEPRELPIENSRGCWWGAKSHCVFCGIRDEDLNYRFRSAEKVLEDMELLHTRYGINNFRFADYILPNRYFDTLLPQLAARGRPYGIGAEVKANISEERFAQLAKAGFKEVQPGIESFSSRTLKTMKKGVSAMQNIFTLLLGRRYGVLVHYNILYGFPGDDETEYARMAQLLPKLFHLSAPVTCLPVQITRYAPLQTHPELFGIDPSKAESGYGLIFSREYSGKTGFDIEDYCYNFQRTFENPPRLQRLYEKIDQSVHLWQTLQMKKMSWLYHEPLTEKGCLTVHDRRGPEETIRTLASPSSEVLLACARPISLDRLRERTPKILSPHSLDAVIDSLDELGLVFREDQQVLSLALARQ